MTRKEYLETSANHGSHREYYGQFVTPEARMEVIQKIGTIALLNAKDSALNDIPLVQWDHLAIVWDTKKMAELGDYPTMAGHVCVMKEAARQIIEEFCTKNHPLNKGN